MKKKPSKKNQNGKLLDAVICLALGLAVLIVFIQVLGHDFINYDDDTYVTENFHVRQGLTIDGVKWAFTSLEHCNWHPITWISHMLDCQLFGLNPSGHHLMNILFHLANSLLLFWILVRMTGCRWRSFFVAGLFAIHPLHIQSVAWIAERKDVLSAFFGFLTIWAYISYVKKQSAGSYALVLMLFALGLMAKPMLITLPIILLLLDFWPLGRIDLSEKRLSDVRKLVWEKTPLFALVIGSAVITYLAQSQGLAVGSLEKFPLGVRIANAFVAYVGYIVKMFAPVNLAVFYPHPGETIAAWKIAGSVGIFMGISAFAVWQAKVRRYIVVGWLWYLITLIPVIGLVQVGWQAMADRYTYIPLIGLFIIIAWGAPEIVKPRLKSLSIPALSLAAVLAVGLFMFAAWKEAGYWRNSETLFARALEVTQNNPVAHNNLGLALAADGKLDEAIENHRRAVEIEPLWADGRYSLGVALLMRGDIDKSIVHLEKALEIHPGYSRAYNNLGVAFIQKGEPEKAVEHLKIAVSINPLSARAHNNLATALIDMGDLDQAVEHLIEALRLDPNLPSARFNLGLALANQGKIHEAAEHYRVTFRLRPDWLDAANNLAWILATQPNSSPDEIAEALKYAKLAAKEDNPAHLGTLAAAYAAAGNFDLAVEIAADALQKAQSTGNQALEQQISESLELYKSGKRKIIEH